MIITDWNKMTIAELEIINKALKKEYVIENGYITEAINTNENTN